MMNASVFLPSDLCLYLSVWLCDDLPACLLDFDLVNFATKDKQDKERGKRQREIERERDRERDRAREEHRDKWAGRERETDEERETEINRKRGREIWHCRLHCPLVEMLRNTIKRWEGAVY